MSIIKITKALKDKNIPIMDVEYQRSCPTPSGYASGYTLIFSDEVIDAVWKLNQSVYIEACVELDNLEDVLDWITTLPTLPIVEVAPIKEVTGVRCNSLSVVCPHCGWEEDWLGDPRGETTTCDHCEKDYKVHQDADIEYW